MLHWELECQTFHFRNSKSLISQSHLVTASHCSTHMARKGVLVLCITAFKCLLYNFVVYLWNVWKERGDGETAVRRVGQAGNLPRMYEEIFDTLAREVTEIECRYIWGNVWTPDRLVQERQRRPIHDQGNKITKHDQQGIQITNSAKTQHSPRMVSPSLPPKLMLPTQSPTLPPRF